MSGGADSTGPAPETRSEKFRILLLGTCAAPIFWLGQLMLSYGITALACYPGDHPQSLVSAGPLLSALLIFDGAALLACAGGGLVSWRAWRRSTDRHQPGIGNELHTSDGRDRFLALWGLMSSVWFFCAILFNTIASVMVPPCLN
jgi:hypothetical protein